MCIRIPIHNTNIFSDRQDMLCRVMRLLRRLHVQRHSSTRIGNETTPDKLAGVPLLFMGEKYNGKFRHYDFMHVSIFT